MRRISVFLVTIVITALSVSLSLNAQEDEKSTLIRYVEEQLSSPNRLISLNGLEGALSSDVKLDNITIADEKGVWLRIEKPHLIWKRSSLLRGRLDVEKLMAERIDFLRKPEPDESLPTPEAQPFKIPELPIAITLKQLSIPIVSFQEDVFGLQSEASLNGHLTASDGSIDLALNINRLGAIPGSLDTVVKYDNSKETVILDVQLNEPENGLIANALDLKDRPPVALSISGDAPLKDLSVVLDFDVNQKSILDGTVAFSRAKGNLTARLNVEGPIGSLIDKKSRLFLGDKTKLSSDLTFLEDGNITIQDFNLDSGVIKATGSAALLADGFLSRFQADIAVEDETGQPVQVLTEQGNSSFKKSTVNVQYDAESNEKWTALFDVTKAKFDNLKIEKIRFVADGTVTDFKNENNRSVRFRLAGGLQGMESSDKALSEALGEQLDLNATGAWKAGNPLHLETLNLTGRTLTANVAGNLSEFTFDGRATAELNDLTAFAPLSGKDLSGRAQLELKGRIEPLTGRFDLTTYGTTQDLTIGQDTVDPLLNGSTQLSGKASRGEQGFSFDNFNVKNPQINMTINGRLATEFADLTFDTLLHDIAVIDDRSKGAIQLTGVLQGDKRPFDTAITLSMVDGQLVNHTARDLALSLMGKIDGTAFSGDLSSRGTIDQSPVQLQAKINLDEDMLHLQDLNGKIIGTEFSGDLKRLANGLFDGEFMLDAADIGPIASFALLEASGIANGTIRIKPEAEKQSMEARFEVQKITYDDKVLGYASIDVRVQDLFGTPAVDAALSGKNARLSGAEIRQFSAQATTTNRKTQFGLKALLNVNGQTALETDGALTQRESGALSIALQSFTAKTSSVNAVLVQPAAIEIADGTTRIEPLILKIGSGTINISGQTDDKLDLNVIAKNLPLDIANAFVPNLGARGVISGTIKVGGASSSPAGSFKLNASGLSVQQLVEAGVSPLQIRSDGRIEGQSIVLTNVSVQNNQGLSVSATGSVPFSGNGLDIAADGTLPLSIAQPLLVERGTKLDGRVNFRVSAEGSTTKPNLNGLITLNNGQLSDPLSNLRLQEIGLLAGLRGDTLTITRANAKLTRGGSISAKGTIGLSDTLPINLEIALQNARYSDGELVQATANGTLSVTGSAARDPLVSGTINIAELEITVPEVFGSGPEFLDVDHFKPTFLISETLERIEQTNPKPSSSRPSIVQLDINVIAPNRIFVRGRGLDAELGGRLRLTGPATDISPVGGFKLSRGRLIVLKKRLDLDSGQVTFSGDFDPILNFVASTKGRDIDAFITLSGRASELDVSFSSTPERPEDEVLAQIIFDRDLSDLSPVQIARLASVAAELAGGGPGVSVVDSLRSGIGLDDLDIVNDDEGGTAVQAGKYINDNVYIGVQAGQETEATINLDITDDLTARGTVETDGDTSIGIFFERDY